MIILLLAKRQRMQAGGFYEKLENPTNANLEGIPVSVIEDALVVDEIMLPFDTGMDGVVVVKVEGWSRRKGSGLVVLEMKIRFPKERAVGIFSYEIIPKV